MKKRILTFFDLSRRGQGGFTLVELIVVIAILGILAGVAVPVYNGYIKKANKQADEQLIADIEQALILGAYAGNYEPGSVVGAVALGKEQDAVIQGNVQDMLDKAFGSGWSTTLQLKSDSFGSSDIADVLKTIQAAQAKGNDIFDSVPLSSFYASEGNTGAIVEDVDGLATALYGVLEGLGSTAFSQFWGTDFHTSVEEGGLKDVWNQDDNDQMAANLTVFAVANQITKYATSNDKTKLDGWVNSWEDSTVENVVTGNGYAADLAMNYAQCVAFKNYVLESDDCNPREKRAIESRYEALETAMANLANSSAYLIDFNAAMDAFWTGLTGEGSLRAKWQAQPEGGGKSQAEIDAEAFIASMTAVNSMEDTYVTKDQSTLLNSSDAFAAIGYEDILDAMVNYAELGELTGDYVIVLSVSEDGTPVVRPSIKEK